MAEVDKNNELPQEEVVENEIDIELPPEEGVVEEAAEAVSDELDFYKNLAEDMDERSLARLS
jgi:hypothetical protein